MKKRVLIVLFVLAGLSLCGCGSNSPKDVVEDFISACEKKNYEKAAGMYYCDAGRFKSREDIDNKWGGWMFDRKTGKQRRKITLSPRDVYYDKNYPGNRCRVYIIIELKDLESLRLYGYAKLSDDLHYFDLEKINGTWAIVSASKLL